MNLFTRVIISWNMPTFKYTPHAMVLVALIDFVMPIVEIASEWSLSAVLSENKVFDNSN